jgi:hypothetical protein
LAYRQTDQLFGILNLNDWDLFGIWFLVLGILVIFTEIGGFSENQSIASSND